MDCRKLDPKDHKNEETAALIIRAVLFVVVVSFGVVAMLKILL